MADAVVARLSGPRSPWYKSVISLGIGLFEIYTPRAAGPRLYKSRRELYLVI